MRSGCDPITSDDGQQSIISDSTATYFGTTTNTGNSDIGNYDTTANYSDSGGTTTTTTDQDQTVYDTATNSDNSTVTGFGDNQDGTYETTTGYTSTATDASTTTNLSMDVSDFSTTTDTGSTTNSGDSDVGDYTLTTHDGTTGTGSDNGVAGNRTFNDTFSSSSGLTSTETGNSSDDTDSLTSTSTSGSTVTNTDTYSGGGGYDTQTNTANSTVTAFSFSDTGDGYVSDSNHGTSGNSTYETGYKTDSYTLSGTSSSNTGSSETDDSDTGDYNLTTSSTDASTYTRTGTDSSGAFTIVQTDSNSGTVHTTGNDDSGDYTAIAIGTDTLTTDENISGTGNSSTLHESVSGGSTLTNIGNDYSGAFDTTNDETNTTTLSQSGYNASGAYTLSESMTDSPTISIWGDGVDGIQTISQAGEQDYSLSQTNTSGSDTYTLTGTGSKPYTITGTDDSNTGDSDRTETGTDTYTLTQNGIASSIGYSISLAGSDTYETDSTENSQTGAFSIGTTGSGTYSKTDLLTTTTTTGSTSFSSTEIGSTRDASLVLTNTGTTRYNALVGFNNTSDGGNGTAGLADYSPVGLPVMVGRASVPAGVFSSVGDDRYDYCFAAGTRIVLGDHPPRNIEEMEEQLRVPAALDTDPESTPTLCHVLRVFRNAPAPIWHVEVGGETIRTTAKHPFYVQGKGWVQAAKLVRGDRLRTFQGGWIAVEDVYDSGAIEPVFNLQVEGARTYFVQLGDGDSSVLVHNDSKPTSAPPQPAVATPGFNALPAYGYTREGVYWYRQGTEKVCPCVICHGHSASGNQLPGLALTDNFVNGTWHRSGSPGDVVQNFAAGMAAAGTKLAVGAGVQYEKACFPILWLVPSVNRTLDGASDKASDWVENSLKSTSPAVVNSNMVMAGRVNGYAIPLMLSGAGAFGEAAEGETFFRTMNVRPANARVAVSRLTPNDFAAEAKAIMDRAAVGVPKNAEWALRLAPGEGRIGFIDEKGRIVADYVMGDGDFLLGTGITHSKLAAQYGLIDAAGNLKPGVEAFSIYNNSGDLIVSGSGGFNASVSAAAQAALRRIYFR